MTKNEDDSTVKKKSENVIKKDIFLLLNDIFDVSGNKGYQKFLFFLIMIDLSGFAIAAFYNLAGINLKGYNEFAWTLLFSLGMIIISDVKKIIGMGRKGIRTDNFSSLVTFIIGVLAFVVAILSLPQFNIISPTMSAVKGIVALIAVSYVIIEAFIVKK